MRISTRGDVDPFIVMDVMAEAHREEMRGRRIVHMEVGQPGTPAPAAARRALARAMETVALGYTVALGLPELRARIARLYGEWYGIDLDPARVVVTSGSSAGFLLAFTSLFDAGDRVAIAEPGYPSYRNILKSLSLEPVGIPTEAAARFQPRPADLDLARSGRLHGVLVASPANPTGSMLARDALVPLVEAAVAQDIAFISDEIYHGIQYGSRAVSALEISDQAYVINSFSKYFSMTGWRVGWMVVPTDHVRRIERLIQNLFICAPHASQIAALAAIDAADELDANLAVYAANRAVMLERLPRVGFGRIAPPDGAFYVYADVSNLSDNSRALARLILQEAGVAVTPGLDFDPSRGHRSLRFSYAGTAAEIVEGLDRLEDWARGRT